jgi:hypothetical protein
MSLLTIVQAAADIIGLPRLSAVVGSIDPNARALLQFANMEGADLASEWDWERLRKVQTFAATAAMIQPGALPPDFDRMVPDTFFNRGNGRPVYGPVSSRHWNAHNAHLATIVYDAYRIEGGNIELIPTPVAGVTYAFEYVSANWCSNSDGSAEYNEWQADTDLPLLDARIVLFGVIWRFKQAKGLDYAEDMRNYERAKIKAMASDGSKGTVYLARGIDNGPRRPAVPDGNWSV